MLDSDRPSAAIGTMTRLDWQLRIALAGLVALVVLPLIPLILAHRVWVRRKGLIGLGEKLTGRGPAVPPHRILVHGVSLGEVTLMQRLIPALEAATDVGCVVATSTETGAATAERLLPAQPRVFLPLDLPWAVAAFLRRVRPRALVLLESELWPMLLAACHLRRIPVFLVNARIGAGSFRNYRRARGLLRPCLAGIRLALAQNRLWAARLRALGMERVAVPGSMKADCVTTADPAARDAEATRLGLPPGPAHEKRILLIASTSEGEEEPLVRSWLAWGRDAGWRCVVCPRHPERGAAVAAACARLGLACHRTSCDAGPPAAEAVIVVDEIGRLAALYANAAIAVVGGSLGSGRGGQNMLEAAAAGAATIVGPDTRNFPDAMALLRTAGAVLVCDPTDPDATLAPLAADPARRAHLGRAGHQAWRAGQGATGRTVAALVAHGIVTTADDRNTGRRAGPNDRTTDIGLRQRSSACP